MSRKKLDNTIALYYIYMECDNCKYIFNSNNIQKSCYSYRYLFIVCKYLNINKVGICFCKNKKKGEQKLKNESVIGICYNIYQLDKINNYKLLMKNKIIWAVQHLQHNDSYNVRLAKLIVNGKIK